MKKKLLALFLCCALSFGLVTAALITPAAADEDFLVYGSDGLVAHTVELAKNNKVALTAVASTGSGVYQWQIQVGGDVWANISGANGVTLDVSYALVANLLYGGAANLRCRLTAGEVVKYTNTVTVQITDETPVSAPAQAPKAPTVISEAQPVGEPVIIPPQTVEETPAPDAAPANDLTANVAPAALADPAPVNDPAPADNGEGEPEPQISTYTILIKYLFKDGKQAANPWSATVAAGSTYTQTITSPVVVGYTPDQAAVEVNASEETTYIVTYQPAEVEFTVKHYQQNVTNDLYTLVDTETKTGFTESPVGDQLAKTYPGFSALLYDTTTKIAADGSTEVEVKYDRYYFLMKFNLNGGYGVEPIYARYGAPINVGEPKMAGYNFNHWAETAGGEEVSLPTVMPAENKTYFAVWNNAEGTKYTVEYFLQDPDDPAKYDYIAFEEHYAATGSTVNGKNFTEIPTGISTINQYERKYAIYNDEKTTGEATVAGDGSTILRVYYDRKDFTLKFYYAMSSGTQYYVVGGSTYYFGYQLASANIDRSNEIALLDQYNTTTSAAYKQRGTVKSLPTLKKAGLYTLGTDTSTVGGTTYYYYYFTFKAKYGADLTELWPVDVLNDVEYTGTQSNGWHGKNAVVSAWNGEYNVYYSQTNPNETIKGKYSELDYQLLWKTDEPEDSTVSYLCFWENGAPISWNTPKLFVYNIWVPVLEGQDTTALNTRTRNGVTYYLRDSYNTVDNSTPAEQTAPSVVGFTYKEWDKNKIEDFDSEKYAEAYDMDFYYTRNQYELNFFGKDEATKKLYYEQPLKGEDYVPDYPANMEPGAYTFGGWYTSRSFADGTYLNFDTAKMPAHSATLYPRWVSETHTVKTYLTKEAMESDEAPLTTIDKVPHGTTVSAPTDPENGEYTFIGWFYMTETGEEQAFNFEMPVKRDLNLYAKWNSDKLLTYTVKYELENGTEIAPPTTGSALAGTTKTFNAKYGTELNEGYQSGNFPKVGSHSITIDIEKPENNTFTFVYVPKAEVEYTVKYLEKGTEKQLADIKTVTTRDAVITETFKQITGYAPDAYQKQLVLAAEGNEIIFWYIKDNEHAPVQIIHWTQNIAGEGYAEYQKSTNLNGVIGTEYSETSLTIPGFTYNETASSASGELTAAGLVLNLYYDRIEYPYEFRFLEQGTDDKELAKSVTGTARYQAQVTQTAKTIPGYTLVSAENQAINIAIEDGGTAVKNVKTFYYVEQTVEIKYVVSGPEGCGTLDNYQESQLKVTTGTVKGAVPTAAEGFKFVGWYKDKDCTQPVDADWIADNKLTPQKTADLGNNVKGYEAATYYAKFEADVANLTITKTGCEDIDAGQSFIFTVTGPNGFSEKIVIQGNGTVVLTGLKIGDYTVTEDTSWSWRYTPDGGAARTITLQAGKTNSVTYVNNRTNNKWLDGNAYAKNVFGTVIETDSGN